jgi:hypothetical protein
MSLEKRILILATGIDSWRYPSLLPFLLILIQILRYVYSGRNLCLLSFSFCPLLQVPQPLSVVSIPSESPPFSAWIVILTSVCSTVSLRKYAATEPLSLCVGCLIICSVHRTRHKSLSPPSQPKGSSIANWIIVLKFSKCLYVHTHLPTAISHHSPHLRSAGYT